MKFRRFKLENVKHAYLFRFLDIFIVIISFQLVNFILNLNLKLEIVNTSLLVGMLYLYICDIFNVHRSWDARDFYKMIGVTWITLVLSLSLAIVIEVLIFGNIVVSEYGLLLWLCFSFPLTYLSRVFKKIYDKTRTFRGVGAKKAAIIGATDVGYDLRRQILKNDELGIKFVGIYEERESSRLSDKFDSLVKGAMNDVMSLIKNNQVDIIYITLPIHAEDRIKHLLFNLGDTTADVHLVPDLSYSNLFYARVNHVGDMDTLAVFEAPYYGVKKFIKRSEDVILSLCILLVICFPLLFIAAGIKLTSKGPVLFKQWRYGLDGKKINVWKFRTMNVTENNNDVAQATKNDSRITPFGGFLRKTSLDELPQFINVLSGSMSIVGPRPHAVAHNEEYRGKIDFYMLRHMVKPGVTGWAQINGWRGETDTLDKMEKRIEHDLYYINNWSLLSDLKIVLLTLVKGFVDDNAY